MFDLQGPPASHATYQLHARVLSRLLRNVPYDDRDDLLQSALARAIPRWNPSRAPWHPWIARVLKGEIARYFRDRRPDRSPLPADLPAPDTEPQILSYLDIALLFDHLPPRQRRAVAAHSGGSTAHRARLQLRQLIEKEVS